ncbi:MAG: hypothetical protein RLZZ165_600 [Bacteroidota bacterium]
MCTVLCLYSLASAQPNPCRCDSAATFESVLERANIAFLGTCIDITPNTNKGGLNVVFKVDSSWKRAIEPMATVHTNSPNQCGYPFRRGLRYIVIANKHHQTIETSECEFNQEWEENGVLTIQRLGKGFSPGRKGLAGKMNIMLIAMGAASLLFLAFVVLRKRMRKPKSVN